MPAYPIIKHSWDSEAKPVNNTVIDTLESGAQHAYVTSGSDWYDVSYVVMIYHDIVGANRDLVRQFYNTNKLAENITFNCKGDRYIGIMTAPPQVEQLSGFGVWQITQTFRAQLV